MKKQVLWVFAVLAGAMSANADTLRLKSGRVVEGTFLAGDTRQMEFLGTDGKRGTFPLADITSLAFSVITPPRPPAGRGVVLPEGTALSVTLLDRIDVDSSAAGQRFRASLADPVMMGGSV